MFDRIAPRYDLLNRLLTLRMDVGWRRAAVRSLRLPAGSAVLDLACGTGDLCRALADAGYAPIGADFSAGMLAVARTHAPLVRADATICRSPTARSRASPAGSRCATSSSSLPCSGSARAVLRPHGRIALLDVNEPTGAPARAVHAFWFRRVVPFVGGLVSDRQAYAYLPASTVYLPPRAELLDLVGERGLHRRRGSVARRGAAQLITGARA